MKRYSLLLLVLIAYQAAVAHAQDVDFAQDIDSGTLDPSKDGVKLAAIATGSEEPFRAGDKVNLLADVNYVLVEPSGFVGLVVHKGDGSGPPLANVKQEVKKGKGTVILKTSFTIPKKEKAIRIYCPLFIKGSDSTSTVDGRLIDFREEENYIKQMKKQKGPH